MSRPRRLRRCRASRSGGGAQGLDRSRSRLPPPGWPTKQGGPRHRPARRRADWGSPSKRINTPAGPCHKDQGGRDPPAETRARARQTHRVAASKGLASLLVHRVRKQCERPRVCVHEIDRSRLPVETRVNRIAPPGARWPPPAARRAGSRNAHARCRRHADHCRRRFDLDARFEPARVRHLEGDLRCPRTSARCIPRSLSTTMRAGAIPFQVREPGGATGLRYRRR